jgi:hypothetical protein
MTANELAGVLSKSSGNMSNILAGRIVNGSKTKPPLDEMDRWARALRLNERETEQLKMLAALEHCPEVVRNFCLLRDFAEHDPAEFSHAALLDQVDDQFVEITALKKEVARLQAQVAGVKMAVLPPERQAASPAQPYQPDDPIEELDRITNPDEHPRPPAPTYPRPAPIRRGPDG